MKAMNQTCEIEKFRNVQLFNNVELFICVRYPNPTERNKLPSVNISVTHHAPMADRLWKEDDGALKPRHGTLTIIPREIKRLTRLVAIYQVYKVNSMVRITGLFKGKIPLPGEVYLQRVSTVESVSLPWGHHEYEVIMASQNICTVQDIRTAHQATSHYLNQWWWNNWRIYASIGLIGVNIWHSFTSLMIMEFSNHIKRNMTIIFVDRGDIWYWKQST